MYEKGVEAFLAVAMSKTLGRAAELLYVTQSTVSYNLKELENDLGVVLVDRQKGVKAVRLTQAGADFLPVALKWQDTAREISEVRNSGFVYSISFGAPENMHISFMPVLYRELLKNDPAVQLRIFTETCGSVYWAVEERTYDLAIVLHEETKRSVRVTPFFREDYVIVRVPEPGEGSAKEISPTMLRPEHEFCIDWGPAYRLWHEHLWGACRSRLRLDSVAAAAMLMTEAGQWCVVPRSVSPFLRLFANNIVIQNIYDAPPDIVYYKVTHMHPRPSAVAALEIFDQAAKKNGLGLF